jgi:hypothetical protein
MTMALFSIDSESMEGLEQDKKTKQRTFFFTSGGVGIRGGCDYNIRR